MSLPVAGAVVGEVALVAHDAHQPKAKHKEISLQRLQRHRRSCDKVHAEKRMKEEKSASILTRQTPRETKAP